MKDIWIVTTNTESYREILPQAMGPDSPITILYDVSEGREWEPETGLRIARAGERPNPAATLTLTLEHSAPDYFEWNAAKFVSGRMRQAMSLDSSDVRFLDIDDSLSSPLTRSMNYQIMELYATEDVSDPGKSDYFPARVRLNPALRPPLTRRISFRPDVTPTQSLFYDRFFSTELLCTDAFALQILESGCTGVRFVDRIDFGDGNALCRTLRGIERRVGWDQNHREITEVVDDIDLAELGAWANDAPRSPPPTGQVHRLANLGSHGSAQPRRAKNRIWSISESFADAMAFVPSATVPDPIIIDNHVREGGWQELARGTYTGRTGERPVPAATLVLALEDFGPDYFKWGGARFVSKRLRQVMAFDPSEVRFLEIEDSLSAPLTRARNYQIMEVYVTEDVSDPGQSDYDMIDLLRDMPPLPATVRRLAFRPDAAPTHDLFQDRFFSTQLLCTDSFALRVLQAGCTGMRFVDPGSYGGGGTLCRTLRGIEKQVGLDRDYREITEVVEAIERGDAAP